MSLTVKDLHELVGKNVEVIFRDGDVPEHWSGLQEVEVVLFF